MYPAYGSRIMKNMQALLPPRLFIGRDMPTSTADLPSHCTTDAYQKE